MQDAVFLYTTWPDAETAEALAREALEQGLCACANLCPPVRSIYRWKDAVEEAVEEAVETPMTLKTTRAAEGALRGLIVARHPYDVPCILALTVDSQASHPEFLQWLQGSVSFAERCAASR